MAYIGPITTVRHLEQPRVNSPLAPERNVPANQVVPETQAVPPIPERRSGERRRRQLPVLVDSRGGDRRKRRRIDIDV